MTEGVEIRALEHTLLPLYFFRHPLFPVDVIQFTRRNLSFARKKIFVEPLELHVVFTLRCATYPEEVKLDTISGTIFLVAKPFNSDPRLYTLKSQTNETMTFESLIYKNPFKITYGYIDSNHFNREIIGIENLDTVRFNFEFERIK